MKTISSWLETTRAKDVMIRDVITFSPSDSLAHAASVLLREQITGAPIVDASGQCCGVFSATDVVKLEERKNPGSEDDVSGYYRSFDVWDKTSKELSGLESIRGKHEQTPLSEAMTRDLVHVAPEATLRLATLRMVDSHVHRILVLDEQKRLQGIISTTDILQALLEQG